MICLSCHFDGPRMRDAIDAQAARIKELEVALRAAVSSLDHYGDESKWGPVADYSSNYWYMEGKPWNIARVSAERAREALKNAEPR